MRTDTDALKGYSASLRGLLTCIVPGFQAEVTEARAVSVCSACVASYQETEQILAAGMAS